MSDKVKKRVNGNRKGKAAERKLVKLFAAWWGSEFFRTPESGGMATRLTKQLGIDLNKFTGDVVTLDETFPFCVESKKVQGWHLEQMLSSDKTLMHEWWNQTVEETPNGKIPLLIFTKNHSPLYAILRTVDMCAPFAAKLSNCKVFSTHLRGEPVQIFLANELFDSSKAGWLYDR